MVYLTGVLHTAWAFSLLLQLRGVDAGCPYTPRGKTKTYKNSCYEFIKEKYFQPDASKLCSEFGGHLVHIYNEETQNWLEKYVTEELQWLSSIDTYNEGIWLGLVKLNSWTWALNNSGKDEKLDYQNWDSMEPDPTAANRKCAQFGHATEFRWRAGLCNMWPYKYYVICQYDGPSGLFAEPKNVIGFCVGITLLVLLVGAGLSLLYCYRRRKALLRQLHNNLESPGTIKKLNTYNIHNIEEVGSTCDNMPPDYFGEVCSSHEGLTPNYNLNIQLASSYEQPKVRDKDLSLTDVREFSSRRTSCGKPQYNRSVSAPAPSANHAVPYFSSIASAPPLEEVGEEENINEDSPLRRPNNLDSNDLS